MQRLKILYLAESRDHVFIPALLSASDLDPCGHNDHCLHGGNCTNNGPNMYHCSCPENYVGENCHRSPSECTVGNCMNGGTCKVYTYTTPF